MSIGWPKTTPTPARWRGAAAFFGASAWVCGWLASWTANASGSWLMAMSTGRPRAISMPLLAAIFSAMGVFGGYVVGVQMLGVDAGAFWSQMQAGVDVWRDVGNSVVKSLVFGVAVAFIALLQGYVAQPTPEGVSRATTRTVVSSALTILALDLVLTAFMLRGDA